MRRGDWLKAIGIALLVMVLDLAIATLAVFGYGWWIEPGRPTAYYQAMAPTIAAWSTGIAGPLLLAGAAYRFGGVPGRSPWAFAVALFVCYVLIDWAMVAFQGLFTPVALLILALKLAGALAGAAAASSRRDSGSATA